MLGEFNTTVRPMEYPVLAGSSLPGEDGGSDPVLAVRKLEERLEQQAQRSAQQLESVRREALERGRQEFAARNSAWRQEAAAALGAALEQFRGERDHYLARAEQEVVRLALAIAERVIRREAQMDPLLLAGAVRVALGQLAESTEVRLRVPVEQQEMWLEMVRLMPGLALRPEVVGDAQLGPVEAILQASLGSVDLGVRAQLAEIERGFFDLLDTRKTADVGRRGTAPAEALPTAS